MATDACRPAHCPETPNCWEFMQCGREPGGARSRELGVCPAAADSSFEGINAGRCAGRICWAVADGLGATAAGAYASEKIKKKVAAITHISPGRESAILEQIAREMDRDLYEESRADPSLDGAGSTFLAVLLRGRKGFWVHVGDSRLYLFRNAAAQQVTCDQTLARFLVAENEITSEQAVYHYSRHVMDQYVGCGFAEPETGQLQLFPSDLLVLTSDGLYKQIGSPTFHRLLGTAAALAEKGRALVDAALAAGGTDNITVVLATT